MMLFFFDYSGGENSTWKIVSCFLEFYRRDIFFPCRNATRFRFNRCVCVSSIDEITPGLLVILSKT